MQIKRMDKIEFKLLEEGDYDAVLHAIIGLGHQKQKAYEGKAKAPAPVIKFIFEIPSLKNEEGKTSVIGYKNVTAFLASKSNLYKLMDVLVDNLTEEKLDDVLTNDMESLIGRSVVLTITHFTPEDKKLQYISKVVKLDPRITPPKAEREGYVFHFDNPDINIFKKISKFTQKKILSAEDSDSLPQAIRDLGDESSKPPMTVEQMDKELPF